MSFLDRFKIQPKHKSPDPEVRIAYVQELPPGAPGEEDAAALVALAREDSDPRVRRAALARIDDVAVLAGMAGSDADSGIREEITGRLAGIAASDSAERAPLALGALSDQKQIATVAKTSPVEAVRADAVARLTDMKSLSSVARHAADPKTAALAAERVSDQAELLNIAAKTEHKDAGVSALERAAAGAALDRATLDGLSERAKSKGVAKRARAMVQAIDEAEAARRAALEQHQQRVAGAIARVEALAVSTTMAGAEQQIDEAETAWRDLTAGPAQEIAAADRARFDSAVAAARATLAREAQERAVRDAREAQLAAGRAARASLCELVDAVHGEDALDRLDQARSEWEGLPADPDAAVHEQFVKRFEESCGRARTRHENRQESAKTNARLEELSREAEQLAAQEDSPAYAWDAISREWRGLHEKTEGLDEAVLQRYTAADTAIRERAEAKKAAAEKAVRQQVQRIDQLIERAHKRAEADDMEKAARELREIQERWKQAAEAPRAQAQTLWHRYRQAADPIQTKAREFFASRAAEREANLKVKLALVERAEALADSTDWIKTAEEMKQLQAEWQASGPVPRPDTRVVWKRFRDACDKFFARRNEDLAQRKEVWATNQARKEALCARAEELAESRDWDKAASELRRLQVEWKAIGPVRRTKSEALWQRFRTAADRFFERYKRRDEI